MSTTNTILKSKKWVLSLREVKELIQKVCFNSSPVQGQSSQSSIIHNFTSEIGSTESNSPKQEPAPGIQYLIHGNRDKAEDVHISGPRKNRKT